MMTGLVQNSWRDKAVLAAAVILPMIFSTPVYAAKVLPDITNTPIDELTYPKDAWAVSMLVLFEMGPKYLSKHEVFEIANPPANSSDQTQSEIKELKNLKAEKRDEATVSLIKKENAEDVFTAIYEHTKLINTLPQTEEVKSFLQSVSLEIGYFIIREKLKFARARPVQLAPELEPVIPTPEHASYPSGHAGQSYGVALMLAEIDPGKAQEYMQIALDIGHRREIAGVHYKSDSEAGRKLAQQVIERLKKNNAFMKDFEKAKKNFVKITQ